MLVEAMLDFPEEDIELVDSTLRDALLFSIKNKLQQTLATAKQGSLLREGAHIALVGRPNVGKSSLLNCLSGEEVAIVSDVPGTTRDVIRQVIQLRGVPLHIMDTAGLRESQDEVENMGMARTHQMVKRADLVLLLLDASGGCSAEDRDIIDSFPQIFRIFWFSHNLTWSAVRCHYPDPMESVLRQNRAWEFEIPSRDAQADRLA